MPILQADQLTKSYGGFKALDDFSLSVDEGGAYGILGPNGSGKTTALSIILGLRHADSGTVRWFDKQNESHLRRFIGSSLESPSFLPGLSGEQNLKISAQIKQVNKGDVDYVLEKTGLTAYRTRKFNQYSMGMKQRLSLAAAMLGNPRILVLDEPTNGLDPQGIYEVREIILNLAAEGKTILMASHILSEVERICTHTIILNKGRVIHDGATDSVLIRKPTLEISADQPDKLYDILSEEEGLRDLHQNEMMITASMNEDYDLGELNRKLVSKGVTPNHLMRKKPTLEQQFIELIREQ